MRIGCSGAVSERTGIGVVQKHLYAHLTAAGHQLFMTDPRDVGTRALDKVRGLSRGLRPYRGPVDVYLSVVPPLPLGVRAPLLTVVHDLRWMRTRSRTGALYRGWDLRRTIENSNKLLCVSENTRRELIKFDSKAKAKCVVQWLGTGQVPEGSFKESDSGLLVLIGGARHKRNDLAASALAAQRPAWVRGIIGVGVSDQVRETLADVYPCEWHTEVPEPQMLAIYQRADYFLMLGTDEGFGLPFVEALAAGCQVIALDHPLAREVLGQAGVLINPGDIDQIARQLGPRPLVPREVRARHLLEFSWTKFGDVCELELERLVDGFKR